MTDRIVRKKRRGPDGSQCAVFGVPHARWGEAVHAVVVLRQKSALTETDLREHCRTLSASYKCPALGKADSDLVITTRQWGAFFGTELNLQLRRRNVATLVMAGISTNIGVESTARDAYERGYQQAFVEDAMAASSTEMHEFPLRTVFPRMGKVRTTAEVIAQLTSCESLRR